MFDETIGNTHGVSPFRPLDRWPAAQRAGKRADDQEDDENDQQEFGDGRGQARQAENAHIGGHQRQNQECESSIQHLRVLIEFA